MLYSPLNLADELRVLAYKAGVAVIARSCASLLRKAIHVQLANVRVHIAMFKMEREDMGRKSLRVCDYEAVFSLVPVDRRKI